MVIFVVFRFHVELSNLAKMKDRFSKGRQIWRSIGDNIVLKCAAYGQPKPVISWMKDGEILKTDSDTIEINSATVEDSGVYECWANNTHGAEYMPFHVNITSECNAIMKILIEGVCSKI